MNERATERIVPPQSRDYSERSNRGVLRCELDGGDDLTAERPQQEAIVAPPATFRLRGVVISADRGAI
jgi:hypothetical protein